MNRFSRYYLLIPAVAVAVADLVLVLVRYPHLPELLPKAMSGGEVTEYMKKWELFIPLVISFLIPVVSFFGLRQPTLYIRSGWFGRKSRVVLNEEGAQRYSTLIAGVMFFLALSVLFGSCQSMFPSRYLLFNILFFVAVGLVFVSCIPIIVISIKYRDENPS